MDNLRSLFDRALDAVVGMDHHGNVIAWNKAAEEVFGWSRESAIGNSMAEMIVPEQYREAHTKGLKHYNKTGQGPVLEKRVKITAIDKSKREFPVELSIFPMGKTDGDIFYAFIRNLEYEEAHRVEQEMRSQEAEVLLAVASKLIEDGSVEDFAHFCLKKVCGVAGLDAAHLFHIRGTGENRRMVSSGIWYISDSRFQPVVDDTSQRTFRIGEGMPGKAWQERGPVFVKSIPEDTDFLRRDSFASVGLVQGVSIPVEQANDVFGAIEFFGTHSSRIDQDVIRLLRTVAKQIGIAILRKSEAEEKEVLRREMAHRVGNSFAILSSIFRASAAKAKSVEELRSGFIERLHSVSQAHNTMPEAGNSASLSDVLSSSLRMISENCRLTFNLPEINVDGDAVLPLSLLFSELGSNHLKHGVPDGEGGVSVSMAHPRNSSAYCITWKEADSRPPQAPHEGYGSFLMRTMVENRLDGKLERKWDGEGLTVSILLPKNIFSRSREE